MTEDTNIIEMPVAEADPVKQAEEIIAKARQEITARLDTAKSEIADTCAKHNVRLQGIAFVNIGGTKIPIQTQLGNLQMEIEVQLADVATLAKG